ncbi:MAG TPA: efflux RND transporter periplasmic adaptor subunit [Steroidobacteraceae bacterium]|nr:efflux RND transporter periplasmic adaptor subunit [Steroidobacteraceae bacterium]
MGVTLSLLVVASWVGYALWQRYMDAPWTRDGRVRADIISVAPDVAGIITDVKVVDNQEVHKGDVLFVVDPARYRLALDHAAASLAESRTEAALKRDQAQRRATLEAVVVSSENQSISKSAAVMAEDKVREAQSAVAAAALNLQRTEVRAPTDGFVVNLNLHPGDYAVVGKAAIAIVDEHSFRVEAYFEETKLPRVHRGDAAEIRMLGSDSRFDGHVEGVARAISEPEVAGLLSNVNPTFHWVRLAQRIPVTIKLDSPPIDGLASGMTCTVIVRSNPKHG